MKRRMKIWALLLTVVLMAVSCDELLDQLNITFDLGPYNVDFVLEPETKGETVSDFDVVLVDLAKEVEDNGGKMDQLDLIKLTSANIKIISGVSNFNAFESFDVYIKTPTKSEKKIAWKNSVPMDVTELVPDFTSDNLKDYLQESEFTIVLKGVLREDLTQQANLQAEISFDVNL